MKAVVCALALCLLLLASSACAMSLQKLASSKAKTEKNEKKLGRGRWAAQSSECYGPAMKLADELIGFANDKDIRGVDHLLSEDFTSFVPQFEGVPREMGKYEFLDFLNTTWTSQGLSVNFPTLRLCSGNYAALVSQSSAFAPDPNKGYVGVTMPIVMFISTTDDNYKINGFTEIWSDGFNQQNNYTQSVAAFDQLAKGSMNKNITAFEDVLATNLVGMILPCGDASAQTPVNKSTVIAAQKEQFKNQRSNTITTKKQWVGGVWVATHFIEMTYLDSGIQEISETLTLMALEQGTYKVLKYMEYGKIWVAEE